MDTWLIDLLGWIPGIIFPGAALLQLREVVRAESTAGVSMAAWGLCAVANLCMYCYTEKFYAPQALLLIVAAGLQFAIVCVLLKRRKERLSE